MSNFHQNEVLLFCYVFLNSVIFENICLHDERVLTGCKSMTVIISEVEFLILCYQSQARHCSEMRFLKVLRLFLNLTGTYPFDDDFNYTKVGLPLTVIHQILSISSSLMMFNGSFFGIPINYRKDKMWHYFDVTLTLLSTPTNVLLCCLYFIKQTGMRKLMGRIEQVTFTASDLPLCAMFKISLSLLLLALFLETCGMSYVDIVEEKSISTSFSHALYISKYVFSISAVYLVAKFLQCFEIFESFIISPYSVREIIRTLEKVLSASEEALHFFQYNIVFIFLWFLTMVMYVLYVIVRGGYCCYYLNLFPWIVGTICFPFCVTSLFSHVKYKARQTLFYYFVNEY